MQSGNCPPSMASLRRKALPAMALSALALTAFVAIRPAYASGTSAFAANFLDLFDYKFDIDAGKVFLNKQVKEDVINGRPRDFAIDSLDRSIMGFAISATDVKIHVQPSKIDSVNTRIDLDIKAKNVAVDSNYLHKKYSQLDVDSVYGVYSARTDKVTVHIPMATALSLLFK
jgi:hypothetical protein